MGTSKTALFLDHIVAAARPVFDAVIAVQRPGGEPASIETIFEEPHHGDGAIYGLVTALRHAQGRAFVLAVDYPLITSEALRFLRDRGGVPVWNGRAQPLCAVWDASMLPRIEQRVAEGKLDLHGVIEQEMIPEPELRAALIGEPLTNVNTPEELLAVGSWRLAGAPAAATPPAESRGTEEPRHRGTKGDA
jgi:molybdopterin-guanine dinucleotide biosynthesis protein A